MNACRCSKFAPAIAFSAWASIGLLTLAHSQPVFGKTPEPLLVTYLETAGFAPLGIWQTDKNGKLKAIPDAPTKAGVYVFCDRGEVLYVGLATMGLAKRLYLYAKPGKSQSTNIRINALIRARLSEGHAIEIYAASPPDLSWNGLPIEGNAGLELGLIEKYAPPWNKRGVQR